MDASPGRIGAASPLRVAAALIAACGLLVRFVGVDVARQAGRPDPRTLTPRILRR